MRTIDQEELSRGGEDDLLELEIHEDGSLRLFCGRGSDVDRSGVRWTFEVLIAGLTWRVLRAAESIAAGPRGYGRAPEDRNPRFSGAWLEHGANVGAVVRLTGSQAVDAETRATLNAALTTDGKPQEATLDIDVRLGGKHTLDELRAEQDRISRLLHSSHPDTAAWIDVPGESLVLEGPTSISDAELARLADVGRVPVRWQYAPPVVPGHVYGGHQVKLEGHNCTAAFTVRDAITGETGVMTAGHCGFPEFTGGEQGAYFEGANFHAITLKGRRWDANQDFQWLTSAYVENPAFWMGLTTEARRARNHEPICQAVRVQVRNQDRIQVRIRPVDSLSSPVRLLAHWPVRRGMGQKSRGVISAAGPETVADHSLLPARHGGYSRGQASVRRARPPRLRRRSGHRPHRILRSRAVHASRSVAIADPCARSKLVVT
jgi:hypothetical protein